ncbi:MAG: RNA polymerase sigma factor [Gemmatimonadetes bacterium]|nr:RNA polymerase sigma factor [Gemmatimonadota bacterium]
MKTPTLDTVLDEYLVTACQHGDRRAFRLLVTRWTPRFRRLAGRFLGDREAAMDVTQEAWIGVVKGLGGLHDPARFRAWSYRIVANKARDYIRRERARSKAPPDDGVQWILQTGEDDPALTRLGEAMGRLSGDQRTLLSLYYGEDLSVSELAVVLGVPKGTIKSRLYHARKALKSLMEAEEET